MTGQLFKLFSCMQYLIIQRCTDLLFFFSDRRHVLYVIYNKVMVIYYKFNSYHIISQREEYNRENVYNRCKHMHTVTVTSLYDYLVIKIYHN